MSSGASIHVHEERPRDTAGVRALHEAAFARADEARLVDALRAADAVVLSLVALREGQVVGHALFSPAVIETPRAEIPVAALAPMAVLPELQRTGIGTALVPEALARLRATGHRIAIVLGHADYYPRFGFEPAAPRGIRCDWPVPDDVFQVLELAPGALDGVSGRARYRPELGT